MTPPCPVLNAFIQSWSTYLSDAERRQLTSPLTLLVAQAPNTIELQQHRRLEILRWHVTTALPAWLESAGFTNQAHILRQSTSDILTNTPCHQETLDLLDHINTTLVDQVNKIDSTVAPMLSRDLRNQASMVLGASGERPALLAATRPYLEYRPWVLLDRASYTAPYAAALIALTTRPPSRCLPFPAKVTTDLQQSIATLLTNLAQPNPTSPPEAPE